jgi:cbb3-type cytochrome oxidase maturation protein
VTVLFLVVPLAILASLVAVVAFAWSVDSGQLDDLETPALRMLGDSETSVRGASAGLEEASRPAHAADGR